MVELPAALLFITTGSVLGLAEIVPAGWMTGIAGGCGGDSVYCRGGCLLWWGGGGMKFTVCAALSSCIGGVPCYRIMAVWSWSRFFWNSVQVLLEFGPLCLQDNLDGSLESRVELALSFC